LLLQSKAKASSCALYERAFRSLAGCCLSTVGATAEEIASFVAGEDVAFGASGALLAAERYDACVSVLDEHVRLRYGVAVDPRDLCDSSAAAKHLDLVDGWMRRRLKSAGVSDAAAAALFATLCDRPVSRGGWTSRRDVKFYVRIAAHACPTECVPPREGGRLRIKHEVAFHKFLRSRGATRREVSYFMRFNAHPAALPPSLTRAEWAEWSAATMRAADAYAKRLFAPPPF
jgi:hypothetical protein